MLLDSCTLPGDKSRCHFTTSWHRPDWCCWRCACLIASRIGSPAAASNTWPHRKTPPPHRFEAASKRIGGGRTPGNRFWFHPRFIGCAINGADFRVTPTSNLAYMPVGVIHCPRNKISAAVSPTNTPTLAGWFTRPMQSSPQSLATSSRNSKPLPAKALPRSPSPRPATLRTSTRLTPSEIESFRAENLRALQTIMELTKD